MIVEARPYDAGMQSDWNALLKRSRNGIFLFDRRYMDYHADRFEDCSVVIFGDNRPIAAMPVSIDRSSGRAVSHGGLTFGGLVVENGLRSDTTIEALDASVALLKSRGATELSVRMLPTIFETYPSAEVGYALWRRGFQLSRRDLSSVLPLDRAPALNSSKKQAVAKARKAGLEVTTGSLAQFHDLLAKVLGWRHGVAPVHSVEELAQLAAAFPDNILLRSVERDGALLAGALVYRYGKVWHTQYMASSPEGRSLGALDLVIASLIEEASADGAAWFSFGTSTTEGGQALNSGLLWQKESFGARSITHDVMSGTL